MFRGGDRVFLVDIGMNEFKAWIRHVDRRADPIRFSTLSQIKMHKYFEDWVGMFVEQEGWILG